ncbi:hypothetical protein HMN09_00445200 [Mycena chlorophos]|uniref:Mitochondrial carrier n=1 Tax=Mycena chlorophos TaxID=658473 RepID=A0A8H6TE12_MYCCL|nr:hypothetical protein HMN09_00445200 [Mycena chlorophos]
MHLPFEDEILLAYSKEALLRILRLGMTMPFLGALVRFRANYTPRRVDDLEAASDSTVVEATSYFGTLKRVYTVQGWAGLYQGIVPSIAEVVLDFIMFFLSIRLAPLMPSVQILPFHLRNLWGLIPFLLLYLLFAAVPVALHVVRVRAIVTRYRLRTLNLGTALRVLLSSAERRNPLRLYQLPGVVFATLLSSIILTTTSLGCLIFFPASTRPAPGQTPIVYPLGIVAVLTVLLTPLEVMRVRLSLQRAGETPATQQRETAAVPEPVESKSETEESPLLAHNVEQEVIQAGTEQPPYTSLRDCARKILEEEGGGALYRGWWITALILFPMFSSLWI